MLEYCMNSKAVPRSGSTGTWISDEAELCPKLVWRNPSRSDFAKNHGLGACESMWSRHSELVRFRYILSLIQSCRAWKQLPLPTLSHHVSWYTMPVSDDPLDEVLRPPPNETPEQRQIRLTREAEAKRVSMAIDASIKAERQVRRRKRIVRLLLLGQSESGKYQSFLLAILSVDQILAGFIGKSTTLRRKI